MGKGGIRRISCTLSATLASIVQGSCGSVTDRVGARFWVGVFLVSVGGCAMLPGVPGRAPAPTALGWSSFRVDGIIVLVRRVREDAQPPPAGEERVLPRPVGTDL